MVLIWLTLKWRWPNGNIALARHLRDIWIPFQVRRGGVKGVARFGWEIEIRESFFCLRLNSMVICKEGINYTFLQMSASASAIAP